MPAAGPLTTSNWAREVPAARTGSAEILFWSAFALWVLLELGLAVRDARRPSAVHGNADAGSQRIFALAIFVGIYLGLRAPSAFPSARIVDGGTIVYVGVALAAAGLALRFWSVRTLGRFFRRSVTIEADHSLVTSGPYRLLRHPSYTGSLLIGLGLGVATGNWLGVCAFFVVPLLGILPRIAVEERALRRRFGASFDTYSARTRRLVPGVW